MKRVDYTRLQESYGGKFVALRDERVIASGDTHDELVRELQAKDLDSDDVVFEFVRPKGRIGAY